jgi:hypothetical protein
MKTDSWKTYTCRYFHDGSWWALDLIARDNADAEARANKLGNLQLLGEVKMQIPVRLPGSSWLARFIVWIRNVLTSGLK